MNISTPWVLWCTPIFLALVILSLFRNQTAIALAAIVAASLRMLVIALAILSLAGPYTSETRPADTLTAYLDVSTSISPEQGEELLEKASKLARDLSVPLRVIPFAKRAAPSHQTVTPGTSYAKLRQKWQVLDVGGTNLEAALAMGTKLPSPAALLLSDGYETSGSVRGLLASIQSQAIFPLTSAGHEGDSSLTISQLTAPHTALTQRSIDVRATLTNLSSKDTSLRPQPARLEIKHGETVILDAKTSINPGEDLSLVAQSDPALEGLHPIQAKLTWSDSQGSHSVTKMIWLAGEKRNKVLVVSGSPEDDRFLSKILKNEAYQLRSFIAPISSSAVGSLQEYRVVVLNNVPASGLPAEILSSMRSFVSNGGGLVVTGGNTSFGLGSYIGSSLEEVLPVRLVPPKQEKKRLNIAVQLVIDKSRSMATDNRLEFAKASAEEVVRTLLDDDYIGVIGFDEVPFIALPLSPLRSVRSTALTRISRLFPTSRTNLFPALDEARRGLSGINAGRKHIIVLTDGKLPDPGPYYFDLVRQARLLGITMSTIMVGTEADDGFLAQLAEIGGGAFYQTADPRNLPKVFLSDVKVASGERTLKEAPKLSVYPGPDPIVSTTLRSFPVIQGFVETKERENANTELVIRDTEGTYPLLASWQLGKGRSVAFTSDTNGRWSADWIRWEKIQEFWSDIVESVQRKEANKKTSNVQFDFRSWVEGSEAVIDLAIFDETSAQSLRADVTTPLGEHRLLDLIAVSPGHYQARLPNATAGSYRADISLGDSDLPPVGWELSGELFGEHSHREANLSLLSEIASRSGGVVDPDSDRLQEFMKQEGKRNSYSHDFLVTALIAFFAELLLRLARLAPRRQQKRA